MAWSFSCIPSRYRAHIRPCIESLLAGILAMGMTLFSTPAHSSQGPEAHGLRLEWKRHADKVTLKLIGASERSLELRYVLKISGGSTSTNSGRARITRDKIQIVAVVTVNATPGWHAELQVTGDQNYTEKASEAQ